MAGLLAIDLPGGPGFVTALERAWDRGDAVLPVDRRLPIAARRALFAALRPTAVVDEHGETALDGDPVEHGDALVVATSGTTGAPKGAVLTHVAVRASALATSRRIGVGATSRWLACLPLAHVGGLSVVTRALVTGTPLTVLSGFDAAAVTAAAQEGCTHVSLVATALRRIDPAIFSCIVLGGSRPPADRPPNAVATYGMTETGSGVVYDGRPLDGVEVRIAADGEVLLRGPMLLRGYRDGSSPVDTDGWLHTGDVGRFLDDGRLQVDGRRGDLIITGGEKVWPDAVEAAIAGLAGVADVAVAGVADAEWGARVVAWVVPAAGTAPTLADVQAVVREHLPRYASPKELRLIGSLPRTALGKVRRSALAGTSAPPTGAE